MAVSKDAEGVGEGRDAAAGRAFPFRAVALVGVMLGLAGAGYALDAGGWLSAARLEQALAAMGPWAFVGFVVLFTIGELLHLPGMLFVVAARLAFGPVQGFAAAYGGAIVAVLAAFLLARAFRGRPGAAPLIRSARIQRWLRRAESRPITSVAALRLVLWLSPPLNYALGWSRIRTRDYALGSALGLVVPIAVVVCSAGMFAR